MERVSRRNFLHLSWTEHNNVLTKKPSPPRNRTRRNMLRAFVGLLASAAALKPTTLHTPAYSAVTTIDSLPELPAGNLAAPVNIPAISLISPIEAATSPQVHAHTVPESPEQKPDIVTYATQQATKAGLDTQRFVKAMRCESMFNPFARSRDNRYHGLMQYDARTWNEALVFYKEFHRIPDMVWTLMQKDIYDPYFHIEVTATFIKKVGYSRWPNC